MIHEKKELAYYSGSSTIFCRPANKNNLDKIKPWFYKLQQEFWGCIWLISRSKNALDNPLACTLIFIILFLCPCKF